MINCPRLYISFSEGNPQKKSSTPFFSGLESVSKLTTSPPSKPKGVTWVGCWKMTGKTWMTQLQGFELSWVLASAKPQVNTRILRLYADRYISRTLCLFGKKTLKQSMFVLYDGPKICFFPKSYPFGNPVKHLFLSEISVSCKIWGSSFPRGSCASDLNEFFVLRKGGLSTGQKKESKRNGLNLNQIASWKTSKMIFEFDCWLSNISGVDLKNLFIDVPYTVHLGAFFSERVSWVSWLVRLLDMDVCGFLMPFKGFRKFRRRLHTERCLEASQNFRSKLWSGNPGSIL